MERTALAWLIAGVVAGWATPAAVAAHDVARQVPTPRPSIDGRWKLLTAEDLRADGTVARLPWGPHPVGAIVVERGHCYVQIMSSDVPSFEAATPPVAQQMRDALLNTYIAYEGPCTIDAAAGSVVLAVEAAWRPDYVGTTQVRYFTVDGDRLTFGPAPGSIRTDSGMLTRRLTLARAK